MTICGPQYTSVLIQAFRYFVHRLRLVLNVRDFLKNPENFEKTYFKDHNITVYPVIIYSQTNEENRCKYSQKPEKNPKIETTAPAEFKDLSNGLDHLFEMEGVLLAHKSEEKAKAKQPAASAPSNPSDKFEFGGPPKTERLFLPDPSLLPSNAPICCYIVHTPNIRGRFDKQKAVALGVPPGPLYGS